MKTLYMFTQLLFYALRPTIIKPLAINSNIVRRTPAAPPPRPPQPPLARAAQPRPAF